MFVLETLTNPIDTPFAVPVAGCAMIFGIVFAGIRAGIRRREIQSTERLAAIAKGVAVPPTVEELAIIHGKPSADSTRRRGNVRMGGIVLVGTAFGLIAFFSLLSAILREPKVLCGVAVGLIPLGIGVALLIDARIQTREMEAASQSAGPTAFPAARDLSL